MMNWTKALVLAYVSLSAISAFAHAENPGVSVTLRTGGGLFGTVVDHSDHGLVVLHGQTPYVFGWSELTTQSAYSVKRKLLLHRRGRGKRMTARDHLAMGRFALWLGREDVAGQEFAQAASVDKNIAILGNEALARYRRRNEIISKEDHPLESVDKQKSNPNVQAEPTALAGQGSAQTRTAVREAYLKQGRRVQKVLGERIVFVESEHFLIWTDWPKRYHKQLRQWCDAIYAALCEQFGLDASRDIFLAKCPIYCFESKLRFRRFAEQFDGFDVSGAVGYSRSIKENGHTHVVVYRQGRSEADFDRAACTLVHEATHAFVHRLHSSRLIPHWVNEGLAELMSERVLGDRCPAGENAEMLSRAYVKHDWPIKAFLENEGPIAVHQYPLAHSLIRFLEGLGSESFGEWMKAIKSGSSISSALTSVYGSMTIDELEARWRVSLRGIVSSEHAAKGNGSDLRFQVRTQVEGITAKNTSGSPSQWPILEQNGQGVGVIDYDGDGLMDLVFPNGSTEPLWRKGKNPGPQLYRNLGKWKFEDVTDRAGVRGNLWSNGVSVADYDADGDYDLYLLNWGPNVLLRNKGDGTFEDVTQKTGTGDPAWSSSAVFADFNGDNRLDVYVSNYVAFDFDDYPRYEKDGGECLYRGFKTGCGPWCYEGQRDTLYIQSADGRFHDRSEKMGLSSTDGFRGFGVVAADWDHDHDIDLFVGCDVMPNLHLENLGRGTFRSVGIKKGGAYNASGAHESGMGVAAADIDLSGTLDLFVTNFAGEKNTFYRNDGGVLVDASADIGVADARGSMGWGVHAQDFDGDGDADVFVANGHIYPQVAQLNDPADSYAQDPQLYRNHHGHRLERMKAEEVFGQTIQASFRGSATVDIDNDGDLDIVAVQHNGSPVFFENRSERKCMVLALTDRNGGRSPMGTRVVVGNGQTHWLLPNQGYQSSNDHRLHVAVPVGRSLVWIEVLWPDGSIEDFRVVWPQERVITLRQSKK